jgi:P-type E1-E2 ATPase
LDIDISSNELLAIAASAESHSEHPLGKAIAAHAREQGIAIQPVTDFTMIPGKGISAKISGKKLLCGNIGYLLENNISLDANTETALEHLRKQGKAVILVSIDGLCKGIVALSDTLRITAKTMVQELKKIRTNTVLLTGDNKDTAHYFSQQAGIASVYSELLPAQKVEQIQVLQNEGRCVCMVGDGVNDAPALKAANVGVAMGSMGSDIAIDAADIALMGDDISKIPYLKRLSNATAKLIIFNIAISIAFNVIGIILSIMGILNPVTGALAHNAGSVLVVLNAALLYDRKYMN